ncbi:MAG: PleD family two-component response regulator [Oceanospirillaceae bacterium]
MAETVCTSILALQIAHDKSPFHFVTISAGVAVLDKNTYHNVD